VPSSLVNIALVACVVVGSALRLWDLGSSRTLFPDEAFSARAANLPVAALWSYISAHDPHPPLYYLVLKPFELLTKSEWGLRLPSALCASAALVVLAWWQRRRGFEGVVVTLLFALAPTEIHYARQVRMYGLMMLAGVLAAWAATSWLADSRRRWIVVATAAGVIAAFSHAMGPILLGGLLLVPGLRRDRPANEWRAANLAGLAVYGLTWAGSMLMWRGSSLYKPPTLDSITITLNELMAAVPGNRWWQLPLVVAGGIVLWSRRDAIARVWIAVFLAPTAALALIAFKVPMFIPKSLIVVGWGLPLAVGALVGWAAERRRAFGLGLLIFQLLLILPFVRLAITETGRTDEIVAAVLSQVHDGDVVVAHGVPWVPAWYLQDRGGATNVPPDQVPAEFNTSDTIVMKVGDRPASGRIWVVDSGIGSPPLDVPIGEPCSAPATFNGTFVLRCFEIPTP
jgi:hypothetical protein